MATTQSTIGPNRRWSNEKPAHLFNTSDSLRAKASCVYRYAATRKARAYAPLVSPQKLSDGINRGGSLGDVAVQMLALRRAGATVEQVQAFATYVQGVADALTGMDGCPVELTYREQALNEVEDRLSMAFIGGRASPDELASAIRAKQSINRVRYAVLMKQTMEGK